MPKIGPSGVARLVRLLGGVAGVAAVAVGCGRLKPNAASGPPDAGGAPSADTDTGAASETHGDATSDTAGAPASAATALPPVLADWPLVRVGVESRQVSSFDRAGATTTASPAPTPPSTSTRAARTSSSTPSDQAASTRSGSRAP